MLFTYNTFFIYLLESSNSCDVKNNIMKMYPILYFDVHIYVYYVYLPTFLRLRSFLYGQLY